MGTLIWGIMNNLMSEHVNDLALALSKAQATIENVSKDKQAYGYKYANLASCLDAVKKPLADNGLAVAQLVSQEGEKHVLVTMLLHESGQWLKSIFSIENVVMKQCNSLQQLGAGITYARRYALSAIIGLTQEDDDAQSIPKKNYTEDKIDDREKDLTVVKTFLQLCREHQLDAKEFAKFHAIDSGNLESVAKGVMNFTELKDQFINTHFT